MDFLKKGGDFFAGLEADLNAGIKDEAPPAVTAAAAPAAADTKTPVAPTNKRARPEEAPSVAQQATREEKPKVRKPRYSSAREAKNDRKNGVKQASIGAFFGS